VSLEATGIYSLDVALALERADGVEVAVLNRQQRIFGNDKSSWP
jgi:hypothetical protein